MKHTVSLFMLSGLVLAGLATAAEPDLSKLPPVSSKKGLTYENDIRPILETSCFRCHGAERPKGGLRLDTLDALMEGGDDGKIVVPGKSKESPLVIAVAQIDDETAMPPKRKPGGPGGFGPGMMLAPQMMKQGDKDSDKKLSKQEFSDLATTWFDKLDPDKAGTLSEEQFTGKFGEILPAPERRGGDRAGGRPDRGPGGPGPAMFVGSALFKATDADKDGSLTREEFQNTFAKWFAAWDAKKTGFLSEDDLRKGLTAVLPPPSFGGPGGPGGRGPGDGPRATRWT